MPSNKEIGRKTAIFVLQFTTMVFVMLLSGYYGTDAFGMENSEDVDQRTIPAEITSKLNVLNESAGSVPVVQPSSLNGFQSASQWPDDDVPGISIPYSPIVEYLNDISDTDDVYSIYLSEGMTFDVSLMGPNYTDFDLRLFSPGTASIVYSSPIADTFSDLHYPDEIQYTVPPGGSGVYYLDVRSMFLWGGSGYYTVWYSALNHSPLGNLDYARGTGGEIAVNGWAIDPDSTSPIDVHLYVDGQASGAITANQSRPDIGAFYPGYGANHGYGTSINAAAGNHTVCAYGINTGLGGNRLLGCRAVYVLPVPVNPIGNLESAKAVPEGIQASGWTLDPNTTAPIDVHIYVNGQFAASLNANGMRNDIAAAFPGYNSNHGFIATVPVNGGSNTVCAYGINSGPGSNILLGCKVVNVPVNPVGNLEAVTAAGTTLNLSGWVLDPNTVAPIDVHVYVNGQFKTVLTANGIRNDIASAFPGYNSNHGYFGSVQAVSSSNTVCAYGINDGPGSNALLGCKVVNILVNPVGNLEMVSLVGSTLNFSGWTFDPNTAAPIDVHVYVNGQFRASLSASAARSDIASVFPSYGGNHGYSGSVPANAGSNTLCAYGINYGLGNNYLLGCRSVN